MINSDIEKKYKPCHKDCCHGKVKYKVLKSCFTFGWYEKECEVRDICFSFNYNIHYMRIGECMDVSYDGFINDNSYKWIDLAIKELYDDEIEKFNSFIPKWEGTDWVYEIVCKNHTWFWCVKTPIKNISNIWLLDNEEKKEIRDMTCSDWLIEENMTYLKKQNFISHRANQYYITPSDINKMIDKLKNKTNGNNK